MLRIVTNSRKFEDETYINYCTWTKDCTAHDAAQDAVDAAQLAYDNAVELKEKLDKEKVRVQDMFEHYTTTYDRLMECGQSIANPMNMGEGGMSDMIECLGNYGSNVEQACNDCQEEIDSCYDALEAAKKTLEDTPCVDVCI